MRPKSRSIKRRIWLYNLASASLDSSSKCTGPETCEASKGFCLVANAVNGVYGVRGNSALPRDSVRVKSAAGSGVWGNTGESDTASASGKIV